MLEHIPKIGRSLRIGTLSEYRKNTESAVRDEDEAKFSFSLRFEEKAVLSQDWLREATYNLWGSGLNGEHYEGIENAYVKELPSDLTTGVLSMSEDKTHAFQSGDVFKMRGSLKLNYESADAFVFCISESKDLNSVIGHQGYNGRWYIPRRNIKEFALVVAAEIAKKVTEGEGISKYTIGPLKMPGFEFPPNDDGKGVFRIEPSIFRVRYVNKEILVEEESDRVLGKIDDAIRESFFRKTPNFKIQEEVRLIFRPVLRVEGGYYHIPNLCNPVFIPVNSILPLLEIS
jgi:hypothetical protein